MHQTPKAAHGGDPRRWRRAVLRYQAGYGYKERKHLANQFGLGEGLVGQCAQEKERILLTDVPGDYVRINSGLWRHRGPRCFSRGGASRLPLRWRA